MNDMRASNIENLQPVCKAPTRQALDDLLTRERVENYRDGNWGKNFRQGGPLEWCNPPWAHDDHLHFVEVNVEERVRRFREGLERDLSGIPDIGIDTTGAEVGPALLAAGAR